MPGQGAPAAAGAVAIWESTDAVSWSRLHIADLFSNATVSSVAGSDGNILLAGRLHEGPGSPWSEDVAVTWRQATAGEMLDSIDQLVRSQ